MKWLNRNEKLTAEQLTKIFLNAKKLADEASNEVTLAEKALDNARKKAAELSKIAHEAAITAWITAKEETTALIDEADVVGKQANFYASQVNLTKFVGPSCSMCHSSPCTCAE